MHQHAKRPNTARRIEILRSAPPELNKKDWAAKHGWQQTQYRHWSTGTRRIPIESALHFCQRYGLTLDDIHLVCENGLSGNARRILPASLSSAQEDLPSAP